MWYVVLPVGHQCQCQCQCLSLQHTGLSFLTFLAWVAELGSCHMPGHKVLSYTYSYNNEHKKHNMVNGAMHNADLCKQLKATLHSCNKLQLDGNVTLQWPMANGLDEHVMEIWTIICVVDTLPTTQQHLSNLKWVNQAGNLKWLIDGEEQTTQMRMHWCQCLWPQLEEGHEIPSSSIILCRVSGYKCTLAKNNHTAFGP